MSKCHPDSVSLSSMLVHSWTGYQHHCRGLGYSSVTLLSRKLIAYTKTSFK